MTPSADQVAAFQANGGFAPSAVSAVVLGFVFAVLLLWGVWAMRTAYVGWAEHRITERQFLAVVVRFVAMYLVLTLQNYGYDIVLLIALLVVASMFVGVCYHAYTRYSEIHTGRATWGQFGLTVAVGAILLVVGIWLLTKATGVL